MSFEIEELEHVWAQPLGVEIEQRPSRSCLVAGVVPFQPLFGQRLELRELATGRCAHGGVANAGIATAGGSLDGRDLAVLLALLTGARIEQDQLVVGDGVECVLLLVRRASHRLVDRVARAVALAARGQLHGNCDRQARHCSHGSIVAEPRSAAICKVSSAMRATSMSRSVSRVHVARTIRGMKRLAPLVLAATLATSAAGCYGSYSAFHAVHKWNGHATNSKIGNSAIHLGLWILPVYELVIVGDFLIFNTVEFATGSPVFK